MKALMFGVAAALAITVQSGAEDLSVFADIEGAWSVAVSQDGRHVATGCGEGGRRSICVIDLGASSVAAVVSAPESAQLTSFTWVSPNHIVYTMRRPQQLSTSQGMRTIEVTRSASYDVQTGLTTVLLNDRPTLVHGAGFASFMLDDPDTVLMQVLYRAGARAVTGSNIRAGTSFQTTVYRVDIGTGRSQSVSETRGSHIDTVYDARGGVVAELHYLQERDLFEIRQPDSPRPVYSAQHRSDMPHVYPGADGGTLILRFPSGPRRGLNRLDIETGSLTPVDAGIPAGGLYSAVFDTWTDAFVGVAWQNEDLPERVFLDPDLDGVQTALSQALGGIRVSLRSWSEDRNIFAFEAREVGLPAEIYVFDRQAGEVTPLANEAARASELPLGTRSALVYEASDGLPIPAFLTLPPGKTAADGPFPLIALPHGGPRAHDDGRYDWWSQAYAHLGYAVFQPNFRGSSGYGEAFIEAGYGHFGDRMIQDIIDGVEHLVETGVAASDGYCAAGASYGGYAALMAGLLDRQGVRCIIAVNAVTEPMSLLGRANVASDRIGLDYWEQYIGSIYMARRDAREISPVRRAHEYAAPILLLHGTDDLTVPFTQSRRFLRERQGSGRVRLIELANEDHYLGLRASRETILTETAAFLAEHLPPGR